MAICESPSICRTSGRSWLSYLFPRTRQGYDGYAGFQPYGRPPTESSEALCCGDVVQTVPTGNYAFVGEQQGRYQMVDQYRYVGGGAEYEPEMAVVVQRRNAGFETFARYCCCFTLLVLCVVVVVAVLAKAYTPADRGFDCQAGLLQAWSVPKMEWCCTREGLGCPKVALGQSVRQEPALAQTTPLPYDCEEEYESWEAAWPDAKKHWCCSHEQRGCPPYSCLNLTSMSAWDAAKKVWCCDHDGVACPSTTTLLGSNYDCSSGLDDWESNWPGPKKKWCCLHEARGCEEEKSFDCRTALETGAWQEHWRMEWCCEKEQVGCTTTTPKPYDCAAAEQQNSQSAWSNSKIHWCCAHELRGCPPFNCSDVSAVSSWSLAQSVYCCETKSVGCTTTTTTTPPRYDCQEGLAQWITEWPEGKKAWCCSREARGCPLFACNASAAAPDQWPKVEQEWCCENKQVGCTTTTTTTTTSPRFDCLDGDQDWLHLWPRAQQEYCCQHQGRGCPDYNCTLEVGGVLDIQQRSVELTVGREVAYVSPAGTLEACTVVQVDVDRVMVHYASGVEEDEWLPLASESIFQVQVPEAWSETQAWWCCTNEQVGCTTSTTSTSRTTTTSTSTSETTTSTSTTAGDKATATTMAAAAWVFPTTPPELEGVSLPFDCKAGYSNWRDGWSEEKKDWCCTHTGRGCPYSCTEQYADWELVWPDAQKEWCCWKAGRGCPQRASDAYDCDAGYDNWQAGWSKGKKEWCCRHARMGCVTPSDPYDCDAGYSNWQEGWSVSKKEWCCENEDKACLQTTTSLPYDCGEGYSNWRAGWSESKKRWCCQKEGKACTTTTTSPPYDCEAGYANWQEGWSVSKKGWCCGNAGIGCDTTSSLPYDCGEGYSNWREGWSESKKRWCCQKEGKACTTTTTSPPYDCEAGYANWQEGWSVSKKEWCCGNAGIVCDTTSSLPYDCGAGYSNWQDGWSVGKKAWCCGNAGIGCDTTAAATSTATRVTTSSTITVTLPPHDCDEGYANWQTAWSEAKQRWCCDEEGLACETMTSLPYECDARTSAWQEQWSMDKTDWCCRHQGIGCASATTTTSPRFDCEEEEEEYAQLRSRWSDEKRGWCCSHAGRGCTTTTTTATEVSLTSTSSVTSTSRISLQDKPTLTETPPIHDKPTAAPDAPIPVPGVQSTCRVYGDPHVETFDASMGGRQRVSFYESGEFWLVRSETVFIQARYLPTPITNGLSVTKEIVIGGGFLVDRGGSAHVLRISARETTWDGVAVLTSFPDEWSNVDPQVSLKYNNEGVVLQDGREGKPMRVLHAELPLGVSVQVNRWTEDAEGDYINTRITMTPQPGQDGHCGNFNGDASDDTRTAIRERMGRDGVAEEDLLFGHKTPTSGSMGDPSVADCPDDTLEAATAICKGSSPNGMASTECIIDVCYGGAQFAEEDSDEDDSDEGSQDALRDSAIDQ